MKHIFTVTVIKGSDGGYNIVTSNHRRKSRSTLRWWKATPRRLEQVMRIIDKCDDIHVAVSEDAPYLYAHIGPKSRDRLIQRVNESYSG